MTTLRQNIYKSIKEDPRNVTDLIRSIALFIPGEHQLSKDVASCLESLRFSPPENHLLILGELLNSIGAAFPGDNVLVGPWWIRVICVLVTGGAPASDELIDSLGRNYPNLSALDQSLN